MADVITYQGDTLPDTTLTLLSADGVGSWLGATDSVSATYSHFDGSTGTAALAVTDYGGASDPAIVVVPAPGSVLSSPAPGTGSILVTRTTVGGDRESIAPLVYVVMPGAAPAGGGS